MAEDRTSRTQEITLADGTKLTLATDSKEWAVIERARETIEEAKFQQARERLETKLFSAVKSAVTAQERAILQGMTLYQRWDGKSNERGIMKSTHVKIVERVTKSFVEEHGLQALMSLISNRKDSKLDRAMVYGALTALEALTQFIYDAAQASGQDIAEVFEMVATPLADVQKAHTLREEKLAKVSEAEAENIEAEAEATTRSLKYPKSHPAGR